METNHTENFDVADRQRQQRDNIQFSDMSEGELVPCYDKKSRTTLIGVLARNI